MQIPEQYQIRYAIKRVYFITNRFVFLGRKTKYENIEGRKTIIPSQLAFSHIKCYALYWYCIGIGIVLKLLF